MTEPTGLQSAFPPLPGDGEMERGSFFVEAGMLMPVTGQPGQARLAVEGFLPTPCNQPRARITPPDAQKRIMVELYSVMPRGMVCAEVIKPFAGVVATLSELTAGEYTVMVNEQEVGTLIVP